jgi:hypothetical protein
LTADSDSIPYHLLRGFYLLHIETVGLRPILSIPHENSFIADNHYYLLLHVL